MIDSLFTLVMCTVVAIALLIITWSVSASNVGMDCEKLGSFYLGDKVYKCEVVK
jgi:hypothetical protein